MDLPLIWAGVIATAVLLYVLLDGFDLGIGALFPFCTDEEQDVMTAAIAPVWDGNETWLVLGGSGLMAAFPLAYAILMPAMYMPIMLMLGALIFRGVAFEFRAHGRKRGRRMWSWAFTGGSILAVVAQGFVLGAFVQGVKIQGRAFAGGPFDWLTPFSALTAVALLAGYALLGACWLIGKTEGELNQKATRWARRLAIAVAVAMTAVSLATLVVNPTITQRWGVVLGGDAPSIDWRRLLMLSPAPLAGAAGIVGLMLSLGREGGGPRPYLFAALAFLAGYAGLALSIAPYVVPFQLTLWQTAAQDNALTLMLWGVGILMPVILGYTGYAYWVFRGKASVEHGYH